MLDQKPSGDRKNAETEGNQGNTANRSSQDAQGTGASIFAPPTVTLPKGGGAIRGMGEKFAANPVTGTGSMTIPIAVSPGRAGFGPQLSLSYDSGAGNGPFGLGWNLSLPAITRKTDKGLPQYNDAEESDVFILSGAEDLVPAFKTNADGKLLLDAQGQPEIDDRSYDVAGKTFRVRHYRPRVEGLFARIERWTNTITGEIHWRSITRDNITTLYGRDNYSRIFDPADLDKDNPADLSKAHPTRIFSWLICASYDDKGNAILYEHKPEDTPAEALAHANEKNRADKTRSVNRYLKRIKYCNRTPHIANEDLAQRTDWLMEVVFDYGDHNPATPTPNDNEEKNAAGARKYPWDIRKDPFSSYRSGFEIRTYRLCRHVLMFHHFEDDPPNTLNGQKGYDGLVRSTDFAYHETPIASFISKVTQSGYKQNGNSYVKRSLPPVEFTYSEANIQDNVEELADGSLENLPYGLDGSSYQWVDLDGEGISGILTEQAGAWFFKRNLSPLTTRRERIEQNGKQVERIITNANFAPIETVALKPNTAITGGLAQFMDLAGNGQPDLVVMDGPMPGFYEHDEASGWNPFRPFTSRLNFDTRDPNLKFVDLNGDGHADVLITEHEALSWHPSLAEEGFGSARRVYKPFDEEKGPALVFADGTQSIYLADFSGDGLTDLVRIRNGEVCYWPNLGHGKFGAKVTMDQSPWFDRPDQFDQRRVRLADIDGSGVTDIIYLHGDGVRLYFNQSGNSWSNAHNLSIFPHTDNLSSVTVTDLLGNGTACLVWSSPLPGDTRRQMRYVDLMGGQKPHLMISSKNNLGAETSVQYASSTKFYLLDKRDGKPWITRLPFPVHVVERVETFDHISRNHFVSLYKYHHGYFDGVEREFRGFGMVEQWDTDEFNKFDSSAANADKSWHMPPVHTRTWFHTGAFFRSQEISRHLAREYFDAPKDAAFEKWLNETLLPDTVLPATALRADEERQAVRALKGAMLRQEVYADDGSAKEGIPYTVIEQNFTIEQVQPQAGNRHAVFFTHPREAISYHYERNLDDPRVTHAMTLEVDSYGNVLRSVAIGYRRNPLPGVSEPEQQQTHITLTANRFANHPNETDWYRIGLPVEAFTFEVVKAPEPQIVNNQIRPFSFTEMRTQAAALFPLNQMEPATAKLWPYEKWDWRANAMNAPPDVRLRLIEGVRTFYRDDALTALLPLGEVEALALPGESYKLALTPGLLAQVYLRKQAGQPDENLLLPNPAGLLQGKGDDQGGYGLLDGNWWIASGRVFFSANNADTAAQELAFAQAHFFLPHRFRDPFDRDTTVSYDAHHLLVTQTADALGNTIAAVNDYRVLQPRLITDPNRNRTEAAFDVLGMVTATAVMGKVNEADGQPKGDLLEDFDADPLLPVVQSFIANPRNQAAAMLGKATTRIVYDLDRFHRCGQPPFAATLARETHFHDPGGAQTKIQISFSYSDGFGREIQKKIQAEGGDAPRRQPDEQLPITKDIRPGALILVNGNPVQGDAPHRWVGTGRTVFNNKGKPVRQYEPFFSATHLYEEEREMTDTGVSPVLFYDPVERVIATLHPNHTYQKVVFDPWQQTTFDVNDTVAPKAPETGDPRTDPDIAGYVKPYFDTQPATWETWLAQRIGNQMGGAERDAARKAEPHANTPAIAHLDTLGRSFLTLAHNGFAPDSTPILFATRVILDIEGNQRAVVDAKHRIVMRYDYDMLGTRIHQASMEAGERWMLNDVTGKPIRAWDSRRFIRRMTYDELRRPRGLFVTENGAERLAEQTVYGERQGDTDNHRTRVYQVKDGAGVVTSELYDFKGNLLRSKRELLPDYKHAVNWQLNPVPNDGTFTTSTTYDALSRPLTVSTPDNSVYRPTFNEANLLDKIDVNLRSAAMATPFVTNINYNAKGQRELIAYGNGAETAYTYDPLTFRLMNLKTTRPPGLNGLASQLFANPTVVQDLRYTYDPVGNITRIEDAALKTIFHNQEQVDPISEYTYDAIYRLIEAKGREHIGQTAIDFDLPNNNQHDRDYPFFGLRDHSNDAQAMRNYTERYEYDEVGNFDVVSHLFSGGGWNRSYEYEADSLLEPATHKSNRLTKTTAGNGGTFPETYTYTDANGDDVHGCMTSINAMTMAWDFEDQLQQVNLGTGGTAYYVYDAGGQRVRKVIETEHGTRKSERIYLVGFEVYHEFNANGTAAKLERQSLHVMDDKQRIALIETKTIENGNEIAMPEPVQRYQLGNHLGSASLELATDGALITYEEYHPYGTTAFQTGRSTAELSLKRYRYTGKERDEETGLNYHAARYYAPWLGRWVSCDPAGLVDGSDLYRYAKNNPVRYSDPKGLDPPDANPPARFGGSLGDFRLRLDPTFMPGSTPPPPTSSAAPGSAAASAPSPEPPVTFRPDASLLPPKLGGAVDFAHRFQLSGRVDTSGIHAEALLRTSPSTDLTLRADSSFGDPLHPRLTLSSGGAAGRGSVVYDTANDQFTFRVQGGSLGTPGLQGDASVSTSGAFSLSTQARIGLPLIDPVRFSLGGNFSTGALSVGVGFGGPLLPDLTQVQPGVQSGGEALTATAADALTIISREGPAPSIATIQGFVARHNAPPAGSTGPSDFARIGTAAEAVQGVARPPQGAPLRGSLDFGINPSHPSGQTDVRLMLRLQITLP